MLALSSFLQSHAETHPALQRAKRLLFLPGRAQRISRRARRWLGERRIGRRGVPEWHYLSEGFWMKLDPQQYWDREVLIERAWEPALSALIRHVVREGEACIDVGAHKGYISCLLATVVGERGLVMSFEPDLRAFEALQENLERNRYHQVKAFPIALSDKDGRMSLTLTETLGWSSQYPNHLALDAACGISRVECLRFDGQERLVSMLSQQNFPFLKIDAEGSEPEIWAGMVQTIQRHKPIISMEINYRSLAAGGFSVPEFRKMMERSGYTESFEARLERKKLKHACRLHPVDITEERPLLVETILVNPQSAYYPRVRELSI
jgi:FkbM family methyltransferase